MTHIIPLNQIVNAVVVSTGAAVALMATTLIAGGIIVGIVSISSAEAKTLTNADAASMPAHEQIARGYAPAIDIDRGWNPAEMVTTRSTVGQDLDRGYNPNSDTDRGYNPAQMDVAKSTVGQDLDRGYNPSSDTDRGANPAQFDLARGGSPLATA